MNRELPMQKKYDKLGPNVVKSLKERHFDAYYCTTSQEALEKLLELIPKEDVVSWGGSQTLSELNIQETLKDKGYEVIDRDLAKTPEERMDLMRKALLCDTFLMSSNAISEDGQLFNIDGNGNRVAAMCFGPKSVIVIAGMNKVVKSAEDAYTRARTIAAPANTQRFDGCKTPCYINGACSDCKSPDSICAYMVATRISRPANKIKVILVGENLGM
ncbi:lactate utilization protein [Terrisporobacter vanillatitrophus]|uniref:lactate utilization protein n=1 Tax=Terrisporobacter vanillatitrophus TaxID=3058402 RepID=UPI003367271D